MGVISWTVGQALWVLLAGQWDRHCGFYYLHSGTGTVGVVVHMWELCECC